MTIKQYFDSITGTAEQRQYLDQICKQSARGFLLSSLAPTSATAETVTEVLSTFTSICKEITFLDAAMASKQIPDSRLKRYGILPTKATADAPGKERH